MKFFQYIYHFFYTAYKLLIPDSNMYLLRNSMGYMTDSSYNDVYANISTDYNCPDYNCPDYNPIAYAPPLPPYPYRQINIILYKPISLMPYTYCIPFDYPFNLNHHKRTYFKYHYNKRKKNRQSARDNQDYNKDYIQDNNDIGLPVT